MRETSSKTATPRYFTSGKLFLSLLFLTGPRTIFEWKERKKNMFTVKKLLCWPIDTAHRTEEIGWSSSTRKLSESRAHNYKHSVRRAPLFHKRSSFRKRTDGKTTGRKLYLFEYCRVSGFVLRLQLFTSCASSEK